MSSLRSIEMSLIEGVFRDGERGYVRDFYNRTFSDFLNRELDIDIDASIYATDGISKDKRLRCFSGLSTTAPQRAPSGSLRASQNAARGRRARLLAPARRDPCGLRP